MAKVMLNGKEFCRAVPVPVAKTKYGATVDNFLGDVNANGELSKPVAIQNLVFDGVKTVGIDALDYAFYQKKISSVSFPELTWIAQSGMSNTFQDCTTLTSISFPVLTKVDPYGMGSTFQGCTALTSVEFPALTTGSLASAFQGCTALTSISFPVLTTLGGQYMSRAFDGCTKLANISFPALTEVGSQGMQYAFQGCTALTSAEFPELTSVGSSGMASMFYLCPNLTSVSFPKLATVGSSGMESILYASSTNPGVLKRIDFPALTSVQTNSFGTTAVLYAFRYRTTMEEIHFRADMQATIEAMSSYAAKWGATNATIYFDL